MNTLGHFAGDTRPRTAAIVTGLGLLAMAVIAPLATFGVVAGLTVPGDVAATAVNITDSVGSLRLAAAGLTVVVVLDIVVAWGLYLVLRDRNRGVALLGAWLRLVYSGMFAFAISDLFRAALAGGTAPEQAVFFLGSFHLLWQMGLFVFGFHLLAIAVLFWRPGVIEKVLGLLLLVAGVGYIVDGAGTMLNPAYDFGLSTFTFVGEILLIVWLFARGGKTVESND